MARHADDFRNTPRERLAISVCRKAVPVSHGISEAFSTGSHAQYPPHPSSWYDHWAPSSIPTASNAQELNPHNRIRPCVRCPGAPSRSAANIRAHGIAHPE